MAEEHQVKNARRHCVAPHPFVKHEAEFAAVTYVEERDIKCVVPTRGETQEAKVNSGERAREWAGRFREQCDWRGEWGVWREPVKRCKRASELQRAALGTSRRDAHAGIGRVPNCCEELVGAREERLCSANARSRFDVVMTVAPMVRIR